MMTLEFIAWDSQGYQHIYEDDLTLSHRFEGVEAQGDFAQTVRLFPTSQLAAVNNAEKFEGWFASVSHAHDP